MVDPKDGSDSFTKSLFVSEGLLLPSKTELAMAAKCKFDLFTITNFSFMDIALHLGLQPAIFAVGKKDLGDRTEQVTDFSILELFTSDNKLDATTEETKTERR
jgi:hypothetical protein